MPGKCKSKTALNSNYIRYETIIRYIYKTVYLDYLFYSDWDLELHSYHIYWNNERTDCIGKIIRSKL